MLDVDDRRARLAGAGEQPPDLVERRVDPRERKLAVDIFTLRVDHDQRGFRKFRGSGRNARELEEGLGCHASAGRAEQKQTPERARLSGVRYRVSLAVGSLKHPNSESSQHHRANKQERGERSQDIQFQGKVHVGLPKLLMTF